LKKSSTSVVVFTFLILVSFHAVADFQKGKLAYDKEDYTTALKEWEPLAEQGHAKAQTSPGGMYFYGLGVTQDYRVAIKWLKLATEQGNDSAQYNLGLMYFYDQGVTQDYKAAFKWNKLAAEQGNVDAHYTLGYMYEHGLGVTQNYKTAIKWFKLATEQGLVQAHYTLGLMYAQGQGQGVRQDYTLTHMWWNIAASKGNEDAIRGRDIIKEQMTIELSRKSP